MAVNINDQRYKAGYKLPYGIWFFYTAAALSIACHWYLGIRMLNTYLEFSRYQFLKSTSNMSALLIWMIYTISLAFVLTVLCITYYVYINRLVRDKSLMITADGIVWLSRDQSIREILWQDVISLKCLNASGKRTPFMHLITSGGRVTIRGGYLLDADKAIELIRTNANLTSEHKGIFWTEYKRTSLL